MRVALRPRSGCLVLCLGLSAFTLLLQTLWVPLELSTDDPAGRSPAGDQGQRSLGFRRLTLRLEALSTQVQRLSRERDAKMTSEALHMLLQSFQQDQQGLAHVVERELKRVSQRLDQFNHHHHHHRPPQATPTRPKDKCVVPVDPAYPVCSEKVEFLHAKWQSDPCYAFYGVDGTTCSILAYLSQIENFCPPQPGRNHSSPPWHQRAQPYTKKASIRTTVSSLYEVLSNSSGPAVRFMRSRVEMMSECWRQAALMMRQHGNNTYTSLMKVLLYPGALTGDAGQRFQATVERGGPLGELVQWADLSACLTILGHHVTFTTSQHHLHRCRFRILDSFGTEPAFNLGSYARARGFQTLWGSWGLQPRQYMTMFPHTPDNSFLGFVSEDAVRAEESDLNRKEKIAVIYGKQEYMWQGLSEYVKVISEELETHATVYQPPGHVSTLPSFVKNHGLLSQEHFLRLLRRAKVFVGLGFPYEGPAAIEAIALGCVFLQPRLNPPHSSHNNDFYKGKPTTRKISSQHPYAEQFIGRPHVWTVDVTNKTQVREAVKEILRTEVKPLTPREFSCEGMLERVHHYITQQNFCTPSVSTWPPESALRVHMGPLSQSCVSVCARASLVCEPSQFHRLNNPDVFARLAIGCSSMTQEVNHIFPAYTPWGRHCGLQQEPLLFSCAGSDPSHRRLCPCRIYQPGQIALSPSNLDL
ncbi:alpha-1,6-mannosylglycoprotein 6-beta-N-acetylglucosaminyltransferase B-like isoform X2 [Festucalex cinctus]